MHTSLPPLLGSLPAALSGGSDQKLLLPCSLLAPGTLPDAPGNLRGEGRHEIAAQLLESNRGYGHPRADELVELLLAPGTEVVVAGQQPGLFGGPMYSLTKLVAVVLWARRLQAAGRAAVPIFWIASSDHDWNEIASCTVHLPGTEAPQAVTLAPPAKTCAPVGSQRLPEEVERVLDGWLEGTRSEPYRACLTQLRSHYAPSRTFAEAFASWWVGVLGEEAPLFLDAQLPSFARAASPHYDALVRRHREIAEHLQRREEQIVARGFSLPVRPQADCPSLFVLDGDERCRVRLTEDGGFELRGGGWQGPLEELLRGIREEPERVSPGVLARPAVQDAVLEPTLFVVGPGELSYMTQAAVVHERLGIRPAALRLRPHALVLDRRRHTHLKELLERDVDLVALLGPQEAFERAVASAVGEGDLNGVAGVREALEALRAPVLAIDQQLASAFEKTSSQVERALEALVDRARKAVARRNDVLQQRAQQLRDLCLPSGVPAERALAGAHFLGLFGPDLVVALFRQLDLASDVLHVIDPTDLDAQHARWPLPPVASVEVVDGRTT